MKVPIIIAVCCFLLTGCDRWGEHRQSVVKNKNSMRERVATPCRRLHEKIAVTNIAVIGSAGGPTTDNRFSCNVISREECELWLEVCDLKDGHQFNEIKDRRTRRKVCAKTCGMDSKYDVDFVIDGEGESVEALVTLWGSHVCCGDANVLFRTNGVFGTWEGR